MTRGYKTGGRVAGTPNKRTKDVIDRLAALGCDPIEGMARIAMDVSNPVEIRGRMYAELAAYLFPKRRAVEVGENVQPIMFNINLAPPRTKEVALEPGGTITPEVRVDAELDEPPGTADLGPVPPEL